MAHELFYVGKKPKQRSKKSVVSGWFKVDGIVGHRINKVKNKESVEFRVKWQDYKEPTWESFTSFVKDTAPMVERYMLTKNLLAPPDFKMEVKRLSLLAQSPVDLTPLQLKELKI